MACEEERRLREEEDQKLAQLRVQIQSDTAADESQLRYTCVVCGWGPGGPLVAGVLWYPS